MNCVFCGIIAGDELAEIIREWPNAMAFTPINPVADGHVLVIPRVHVRDAVEDLAVTAVTMKAAAELATSYSERVSPALSRDSKIYRRWTDAALGDDGGSARGAQVRWDGPAEVERLRGLAAPMSHPWPFSS